MPRICQFQHLPLNRALRLLATTTTRPQPSTTLDPYLAASRATPRQARESTQTLQAFYVERHLSACASRAGLVVAKLRHASDVYGWADDGSLFKTA